MCNCRVPAARILHFGRVYRHLYITKRFCLTVPVPHVAAWLLFLFKEETFHYRIGTGSGSRDDTGTAGRCDSEKIGVSHTVFRYFGCQPIPFGGSISPFAKVCSRLPVASFEVFIASFFFCQVGTGFDGGIINLFEYSVYKPEMFFAFPADIAYGKCVVITAYSQSDTAVTLVGDLRKGSG